MKISPCSQEKSTNKRSRIILQIGTSIFCSFIKNHSIKNCCNLNICALRKTHETFFTLFFTNVTTP